MLTELRWEGRGGASAREGGLSYLSKTDKIRYLEGVGDSEARVRHKTIYRAGVLIEPFRSILVSRPHEQQDRYK